MMTPTWDCDYGNYRDMNNEYDWRDYFFSGKKARQKAKDKYHQWWMEIVDEIAHDNGLDTTEWTMDDYRWFSEEMDLY